MQLCECGCGQPAPIATVTNRKAGRVAGRPCRFVQGHNGRRPPSDERDCTKCKRTLPISDFYTARGDCKACVLDYQRRARREGRLAPAVRDPEKVRQWNRETYERNREKRLTNVRAWQEANPEKVRDIKRRAQARRRSRKLSQFVEDVDTAVLILRDEGRCGICGEDLDGPDFHIDHVMPLARGGEHSMANVQLAHATCNIRKNAKVAA